MEEDNRLRQRSKQKTFESYDFKHLKNRNQYQKLDKSFGPTQEKLKTTGKI